MSHSLNRVTPDASGHHHYDTLLGSCSTCASEVPISDDLSYQHRVYTYTGDPEVLKMLVAKSLDTTAHMSVFYNCDGEIKGLSYNESYNRHSHVWISDGEIKGLSYHESYNRHSHVWINNGHGTVVIFPTHPRYESFPFPEVEIDPSGTVGKEIASWDLRDVIPEGLEY